MRVERQRRHAVDRRQIRQPAIGADERARAADHLRLDLEVVPRRHQVIDAVNARILADRHLPVIVDVQIRIEQHDVAGFGQRLRAGA